MVNNNNVQNVKFLRNGVVFTPSNDKTARQVALDAMEQQKANLADGTAILGRYKETDGIVKTLVGFAYISDNEKTLTVFDVDGAGADVDEKIKTAIEALNAEITSSDNTNVQVKVTEVGGKITAVNITTDNTVNSGDVNTAITNAINELDGSVVAESGFYVKSVTEVDGKISGTTEALPSLEEVKEIGKPIVAVSENKGQVAASVGNINAEFVDIADNGGKFTATTVEDALAEIATKIDAMDLAVVSGDGEVITAVSEEDGKVSASKTAIKDVKLTGYAKNTTATGAISATDDIEDALSKLENKAAAITIANADSSINVTTGATGTDINVNIKSGEKVIKKDGNGGLYTDLDLVKITENLPTTVKERYQLLASNDSQIGANIDIYKDSSISKIYLGYSDDTVDENTGVITSGTTGEPQSLNYVYHKEDGKYEMVHVDVSKFLVESEFASGVTADAIGVVHGVVDTNSETNSGGTAFLTVDADGFKVNGIKQEIIDRINELNATVGSTDVEGGKHVAVQVVEGAGKLTAVTVNEKNIADANKLADLSGKTVTEVASSNDSIKATPSEATDGTKHLDIITDASKIKMSGFTKADAFTKITESSSVTDALLEVDKVITEKAEVISTALNGLEATKAEKAALDAEIAARKAVDGQSGQTYAANTSANYISEATTLNDADIKLDIALKALDDDVIKSVKVNNVALGKTSNAVNVQISSTPASGTSASPIIVNTDKTTGAVTLQILQIDCGEY